MSIIGGSITGIQLYLEIEFESYGVELKNLFYCQFSTERFNRMVWFLVVSTLTMSNLNTVESLYNALSERLLLTKMVHYIETFRSSYKPLCCKNSALYRGCVILGPDRITIRILTKTCLSPKLWPKYVFDIFQKFSLLSSS